MKLFRTLLVAVIVFTMILSMTACNESNNTNLDGGAIVADSQKRAVEVSSLEDYSADRECWLSIPDSELVLNPFPFSANLDIDCRQTDFNERSNLVIDIGVLDYSSNGKNLENILGCAAVNPYGGYLYANTNSDYGWRPDRLIYKAEYDSGLTLDAYDYFYDTNTIVRNVEPNDKAFVFRGGYAAAGINFLRLQDDKTFVYRRTDGMTLAISFSCEGQWLFYSSEVDFVNDVDASAEPFQTGVWCFKPVNADIVSASVGVSGFGDKTEAVVARAQKPFKQNDFVMQAGEREKEWNKLLSDCPIPETFDFLGEFDSKGVSATDVRNYYYRSWTQIISNVLPSNNNFAYRSISVGKASLWNEGSPECKYSAVWEALYGIQMMSFVNPDIAWELCEGIMSIVPADGNILGESLPSNKAHTVWICYNAKQDKAKLAECVEPLTRYLNWRFENPRWIIGSHNNIDERDLDFASSYLVDLHYMIEICKELGKTEDVSYWQEKASAMYKNIGEWFYNGETPVQYYYVNNNLTASGMPLWICKTLWADQLEGETLQKTLDLAVSQYDISKDFVGFGEVKYDSWSFTLYGLVKYGRADIAGDMVQSMLRDIPRSGFIGELYNAHWRGTVCEGVRPSMFGACLMIDNVWMRNGFMYHFGGVGAINLFDGEGGVSNINLNDSAYAIHMNGTQNKYTVTTDGQATNYDIAQGSYKTAE